ncbi:YciI family protein [Dyella subtropica]|uniref:YciI family protein n=1 Tax=Dyella subtropica TaxID=2992127 RepID=UPI00225A76CA|nr:YciI family protein [Dyella subtropica]
MKFLAMIYCDASLHANLPEVEFATLMRGCFAKADQLQEEGKLLDCQQLETPERSRTLRVRNGRTTIVDGPFAETKEYLGGFNLIEAENMDEALHIASAFPWARFGSIEVRPVRDMNEVRERVGAAI